MHPMKMRAFKLSEFCFFLSFFFVHSGGLAAWRGVLGV